MAVLSWLLLQHEETSFATLNPVNYAPLLDSGSHENCLQKMYSCGPRNISPTQKVKEYPYLLNFLPVLRP